MIITIILIISTLLLSSCELFDEDEDDNSICICPYASSFVGYEVENAGSAHYNGRYNYKHQYVNDKRIYIHEDNTEYRIEYDETNYWCLKDNGITQYCTQYCPQSLPHACASAFDIIHNGTPPAPIFEKILEPLLIRCKDLDGCDFNNYKQ